MRSRRLKFGICKELLLFQLSYWVICFEGGEERVPSFCWGDDAGLDRFWLYHPLNLVSFINKAFELLLYACVLMSPYYICMFDLC